MTSLVTPDPRRGRRGCLVVAALFMLPLAFAFWLYYGNAGWRPPGTTNQGDLLRPPRAWPALELVDAGGRPAPDALLRGRWTMLYIDDGHCDARCQKALYLTRQTRLALNKDIDRVRRVYLATGACCDRDNFSAEHPDLAVAVLSSAQQAELMLFLPSYDGVPAIESGRIYLVDPLGNLMMSYASGAPDKALLSDLTRLLKLSHIG